MFRPREWPISKKGRRTSFEITFIPFISSQSQGYRLHFWCKHVFRLSCGLKHGITNKICWTYPITAQNLSNIEYRYHRSPPFSKLPKKICQNLDFKQPPSHHFSCNSNTHEITITYLAPSVFFWNSDTIIYLSRAELGEKLTQLERSWNAFPIPSF